ncbi:MAG: PmbA protein [Planctomycetota bacterium]|jgi:PmbA protein
MTMDAAQALSTAQQIVGTDSASEIEVAIDQTRETFVRFANTGPTQNADRDRVDVSIRVRMKESEGYREASASCTSLGAAETRATLARALDLAQYSAPNSELAPMGGSVDLAESSLELGDEEHDFEAKAGWIKRAIDASKQRELHAAGLISTQGSIRTIVNSSGREVQGALTRADFALTATSRGGEGWGGCIAAKVADIDPDVVIERAVQKAHANLNPIAIEPGAFTVVLEPAAVSALLLWGSYYGFGAQEVMEQSSFLCGREGKVLFPRDLLLTDDANNAQYPGLPFDGEGNPKERVVLLADGAFGQPVTDLNTARKLGVPCSGHSLSQPNTHGPMACNLVLAAGDKSREELLAGIDRGLLITQFHYTNMIEPRDMTLTGMTRNGTFLIENGEIKNAVKNLRFTQSLIQALENITGVGATPEVTGALFDGEIVTPALRVDNFRFTSSSDF